jgi:rod shape determining protein RodA
MAVISSPVSVGASPVKGGWRDLDWVMLLVVLTLSVWGCFTIRSATMPREDSGIVRAVPGVGVSTPTAKPKTERISDVTKQIAWVVIGITVMLALALSNYQWLVHFQTILYVLNLAFLTLILVLPASLAPTINGAKSWIRLGPVALQPAEFCKFATIICLAAFLARRQERIREISTFGWSLLYLAPALLLILKQPDFGTMLAVLAIWFGMMYFGGARLLHLGVVAALGVLLFGAAWKAGVLKPHQKERLAVFLEKESKLSSTREGYQIKQSQIAIGSGQIVGQGYTEGMQNRSGYVPENKTDFIFTVVAEEFGFVGGVVLLLLYFILLVRTAMVATSTENYFGVLIAGGFTALLAFHTIQNIGMTMRVMPITGVPLPFFSYGGSSFLAFSMCVGLMQSIAMRRKRASF